MRQTRDAQVMALDVTFPQFWIAATALFMLQVLDVSTTYAIISAGGWEGNPLSASVLSAGGFGALLMTKLALSGLTVLSAAKLVRRGLVHLARPAMFGVLAVYVLAVGSNLHQLAAATL